MHDSGITCTNNPGSFSCVCNAGYSGITIDDINECLTNNGGCSINAMCTNTIGSFDCTCQTGYSGDGISCTESFYYVSTKTATTSGADTTSRVYIKLKGTKGESQLLLLRNGFQKGKAFTKRFLFKKVGNIGVLTQVYLELDPPTDQWRYSTLSIIDNFGFEYIFDQSKVLNSNIPSFWLKAPSTYEVSTTTATTNGAGTRGTISIKFKGTNGESKLLPFRKGFTKGWINTNTFKISSIGELENLYLELDTPEDQWRFSTISIKQNGHILYTFNKSYALKITLPSVWLKSPEITYLENDIGLS